MVPRSTRSCADGPVPRQPHRPAGRRHRRLVRHRPGHRHRPGGGRPPGGPRRPSGRRVQGRRRRPSGPRAARRSPSTSTWPMATRSSGSRRRPSTPSARSRSSCRTPLRTWPAPCSTPSPTSSRACSAVNIGGTHRLVRALLPGLVERRRGDIVFVTSDVVERPRPTMAAYVTSKWGLEGYVRSLQMELEGTGVRATILRPGPTLTGMGMDWDPEVTGAIIEQWAAWGFARHANFMRPAGGGRGRLRGGVPSPGYPRHRHRTAARGADCAAAPNKEHHDGRRHRNA